MNMVIPIKLYSMAEKSPTMRTTSSTGTITYYAQFRVQIVLQQCSAAQQWFQPPAAVSSAQQSVCNSVDLPTASAVGGQNGGKEQKLEPTRPVTSSVTEHMQERRFVWLQ